MIPLLSPNIYTGLKSQVGLLQTAHSLANAATGRGLGPIFSQMTLA